MKIKPSQEKSQIDRVAMYRAEFVSVFSSSAGFIKKRWPWLVGVLCVWVFVAMLCDVECADQNILARGSHVFALSKLFYSSADAHLEDKPPSGDLALFPQGVKSIEPKYIRQGDVYDCRFLSTLAAFASTDKGKKAIHDMILSNKDGSYTVIFPGKRNEPITVPPLAERELELYATAHALDREYAGMWLPVVEKAYGKYRTIHQSPVDHLFRFIKHGIFELRWTSTPQLMGFGAAYGASDDVASEILTGNKLQRFKTTSWELGAFGLGKDYVSLRQIRSWLNRDGVVAEIYNEQHSSLAEARENGCMATATTEISGDADSCGLRSSHAYSIVGYNPATKRIRLCDPYGNGDFVDPVTGRFRDWPDDGIFELSLPEFNKFFSHWAVEEMPNSYASQRI